MTNNHPHRSTERVTIETIRGRRERVTLPSPMWEGHVNIGTGLTLEAIYYGPRTGRMFARHYSIWQRNDGTGRVEGTTYSEIDPDEYLHLYNLADVEPIGVDAHPV